jgi:UDP-N-acetylmuramyl tripeptide synthase
MNILRSVGKNGSALPGLVMEKLYPNFLVKVLKPEESKIILVTGTNGKTTSTKMLVAGLRSAGSRVVTNGTGSNMTRGLIAALIEDMTYFGSLKQTDWFIFEMDEAYTPIFTKNLAPKVFVALNVLRDQLDRYGEIDKTAHLIEKAGINSQLFIYNALDPLLSSAGERVANAGKAVSSFGATDKLLSQVRNEQSTHGGQVVHKESEFTLQSVKETEHLQTVTISYGNNQSKTLDIPVKGFHNALNMVAVYATLKQVLKSDTEIEKAIKGITNMPIPFGRGEQLTIKNKKITVALVKNPSGFASNLTTFVKNSKPDVVLFVVNDRIADGRDVSWLWDLNFINSIDKKTTLYTTGIRGADMALRLKHDNFKAINIAQVDSAIATIMKLGQQNIVVIPTYTALFEVRRALSKYGKVPRIW